MPTLYDLSTAYATLLDCYDAAEDDETRSCVLDEIAGLQGDISDKAEAYARIMRNKQAEADALKAEADRLTAKRKAAENCVERLKGALLDAMRLAQTDTIPTTIGKWRIQKNPYSCEVTDPDLVPAEFRTPQPDKIERMELLKHFKETGECFPGVEFKQTESIRFR